MPFRGARLKRQSRFNGSMESHRPVNAHIVAVVPTFRRLTPTTVRQLTAYSTRSGRVCFAQQGGELFELKNSN
jgi:hypothetical protein